MTSDATIAGVIDEIYDAALTPSRWPAALKLASAFLKGGPALLFSEDRARRSGQFHFAWNVPERFTTLYFQDILKCNPLLPLMIYVNPGQPFTASALMPYDELRASRFFTEYMNPQSMIDIVGAMLEQSATAHVLVGFGRSQRQGLVDAEAQRRMRLLAPHFRRAVAIGKLIDLRTVEAEQLADVLDNLDTAVMLIDADARIMRANARGRAMLESSSPVYSHHGYLTSRDPETIRTLHGLFRNLRSAAPDIPADAVSLTGSADEPYVVHVLPLTSGARRSASGHGANAAVFIRQVGFDAPPSIALVAKTFHLTPAEVRVVHALMCEIESLDAIAATIGISTATVKTHLQHVFEKTDVRASQHWSSWWRPTRHPFADGSFGRLRHQPNG